MGNITVSVDEQTKKKAEKLSKITEFARKRRPL